MPVKKKNSRKIKVVSRKKKNTTNKKKIIKKITKKPVLVKAKKNDVHLPKISVIGVGGSGNNAINYMIKKGVKHVKFIAVNTDLQDLNQSKATKKLKIGQELTKGAGAGMNPEVGKQAAIEAADDLVNILQDTQMLFITCGMGGGTGTGAAPVIASIAKELGILTIAVVTKPFSFEGRKRYELAEEGIENLSKDIDSYIVIENSKILETTNEDATLDEAFALSDEVLRQAVEGISDLITRPGIINIDYADIKAVLEDSKLSLIGIGSARGEDRDKKAAEAAINSPLIETSTKGAASVLFSIASTGDLKMQEISNIADYITEEVSNDAIIKFGTLKNTKLRKGEVKVTVIASNFDSFPGGISESKSFGLSLQKPKENLKDDLEQQNDILENNEKQDEPKGFFGILKSLIIGNK